MKIKKITINEGQMMKDIIPLLETNTIYNKSIPGIGATTLEIDSNRNSILVLPFVPVIIGKKHDKDGKLRKDILGVYGDKGVAYIAEYLESRKNQTKKILCTPEKFSLVIKAIIDSGENPYHSYFLLIDECETMIKDIDFRPKIKLPMKDFFQFRNKAMISATPIIPRDPRFSNHGFTYVKIIPGKDRKYKVNLDLKGTNNVVSVLRSYIQEHEEETICIFTNCVKTISKIISDLKIQDSVKVFCSERLIIKRFKATGVKNTYTSIKACTDGLANINFFTGRFFSAVDMVFPEIKPHVIMVTNIYHSNHSKIDPATDAIQISGRFRNGIKQLVHISNFNPDIPYRTKQEMSDEIDEYLIVYKHLNKFKNQSNATSYRTNLINQIFEEPPFVKMITEGKLDTYLADNLQHQEFVSSYYSNYEKLKSVYQETKYFKVQGSYKTLKFSDQDIMKKDEVTGSKWRKSVAELLNEFVTHSFPYELDLAYYKELNEFKLMDEVIFEAYFELGIEYLETSNYVLKTIKTGLLNKHKENLKTSEVIREAVYITFNTNQTVTTIECKVKLQAIYDLYASTPINAVGTDIKHYFKTTETHNISRPDGNHRGWRLGEKKFNN